MSARPSAAQAESGKGDGLFRPLRLRGMQLPNRILMTTVKLGYASPAGEVNRRHTAFYARRARGGVGLLTTEPLWVLPSGREQAGQLGIHDDTVLSGLTKLAGAVHDAGGLIMAHINHAGRAANPQLVPAGERVSASAVPCPANGVVPRPLGRSEIASVVTAFGEAGARARAAGFDAIEISFSHGYLIHQFLSPHTNRRTDEFGGPLMNRLRFGREVLQAVRAAVGPAMPVFVRLNAVDYVPGGLELEDTIPVAQALADLEVDALSITSGTMCESVPYCLYPTGMPQAHLLPMAACIRSACGLPVAVAGRIRSPAVARDALAAGQADLIGLGRPLLADPDWARKAERGDESAILLCAACHQGCLGQLRRGSGTQCLFNPLTGHESEPEPLPAPEARRVVVVGGGPAGLEVARVAAERGHRVSLYEQKDHFGGQLALAGRVPHKEGFADAVHYLESMARRAGAVLHPGVTATAETLLAGKPDAVVLATGGIPLCVELTGLEQACWAPAGDILDGVVEVTARDVLVVGGGLVGLEAAEFLAASSRRVTVAEIQETVGAGLDPLPRAMLLQRLEQAGVQLLTGTKVVDIAGGEAMMERNGELLRVPAAMVVLAVGARPNRDLVDELEASGVELYVIGDAHEPRGALEAMREAYETGIRL